MTRGNAHLRSPSPPRCWSRVPWIIGNEFYINMASQVLIYALFALSAST